MNIPLNSGEHGVTKSDIDKYKSLYPAVDIMAELRAMVGWCDANKPKRKTKSGIARFINSWLAKAQNQGGRGYSQPQQQHKTSQSSLIERANSGELYQDNIGFYLAPNGKKYACAIDYHMGKEPLPC